MTGDPPLLTATGLSKRFGALLVLDGVDLTIAAGEAIGIVGPNGAGKTTLLGVLSGAHPPSAGAVRFRGVNISRLPAAERCRRGIVRTHQIPRPFGGHEDVFEHRHAAERPRDLVFENVFVAASRAGAPMRQAEVYERCIDSLTVCGMLDIANRRAETVGLLDRKRLELARALATGPQLLLLDEIGGGLTDAEASELVAAIQELRRRGITIVWIEHIVHVLLQVAERLICMDGGRIIADGLPPAVMADRQVIDAYLGGAAA